MTHDSRGRLTVDLGGAWRLYWGNGPIPAGAQALGTVTRGIGDTGALLCTGVGIYTQGNAGVLRSIEQRKVAAAIERAEPAHGGARAGSGRPTIAEAPMQRKNVTLDATSITALRALGAGDLSLGIRRAAAKLQHRQSSVVR